jgi:hypothetical protein
VKQRSVVAPAAKWLEALPLCRADKEKPIQGNGKRLLKI